VRGQAFEATLEPVVYLLTWQPRAVWATLHKQAFRRRGGAPRVLVLNNLREGVLMLDVYDPTINPLDVTIGVHIAWAGVPLG
jgi:hypothetical protein